MDRKLMMNKKLIGLVAAISCVIVALFFFMPLLYQAEPSSAGPTRVDIVVHTWVRQYRDGVLISETYHPMSLTTAGKDWIADKLFNSAGTNVTKFAMYIATSNSTDVFNLAWNALPSEITVNGVERSLAAWTDTGSGTANLTKSFSVLGTQTTQLYGLYYDTYANAALSTLIAAEQQGAGAAKNLLNGDTLTVTVQITVS